MRSRAAIAAAAILAVVPASPSAAGRTPVVLFPAYTGNKVRVMVNDQVAYPECPRSGTFDDWFGNDAPSTTSARCVATSS
jgi:lecithin-cholesterol acyltransferase